MVLDTSWALTSSSTVFHIWSYKCTRFAPGQSLYVTDSTSCYAHGGGCLFQATLLLQNELANWGAMVPDLSGLELGRCILRYYLSVRLLCCSLHKPLRRGYIATRRVHSQSVGRLIFGGHTTTILWIHYQYHFGGYTAVRGVQYYQLVRVLLVG